MMNVKIKKSLLWILDLVLNAVVIFVLVVVIELWLIAPFDVSGASMCDTLNNIDGVCQQQKGEKIILNEAAYLIGKPQRGDIVVFKPSNEEDKYFIKRIIGLPNEKVEIKDGEVYITEARAQDSYKLNETYLNDTNKNHTKNYFSDMKVYQTPEGKYFVMGDNRIASTDSRSCFQSSISSKCKDHPELAFVDESAIRGKAWFVFWPLSNIRTFSLHDYKTSDSLEEK